MQTSLRGHHSCNCSKRLTCASASRRQTRAAAVKAAGAQQFSHVQQLSTVMLVNENLRRRLGRGLVQPEQLIKSLELVQQANFAIVVARLQQSEAQHQQQHGSLLQDMQCQVAFANAAATGLLCPDGQQPLQAIQLPAGITAVASQCSSSIQQHERQRQDQQQSSCQVFEALHWRYAAERDVTVDKMLVCPVDAPNGTFFGLALLFDRWSYPSEGCIGAPGYPRVRSSELATEEQLQQAADAVRQQADAVRQLKQGRGLSNKDPEVAAAVAELQQLKQQLARLEGLQATFQQNRHSIIQELTDVYHAQQ
eukprot:GHUV01033200.1.p1 GENE.GHUV01033200.1~~GHUV01033200.1.p1  ORF type:complete len:309 (+),score=115.28 GHUV01033200.1:93-1019(+)